MDNSDDDVKLEEEIKAELDRISISSLEIKDDDSDSPLEAWNESQSDSDELPESVLYCINFVKNRSKNAESIILQDLEDTDISSYSLGTDSHNTADFMNKLTSEYDEHRELLNEEVSFETEKEELDINVTDHDTSQANSGDLNVGEQYSSGDAELILHFEYCEVEERCRQAYEVWENKQKELEEQEREMLKTQREREEKQYQEEEEERQHLQKEFEVEKKKLEDIHEQEQCKMNAELQEQQKVWEEKLKQHEALMRSLQLKVEEERKRFEDQKTKQKLHLLDQQHKAAIKLQTSFRKFVVYKKYNPILKYLREKNKKKEIQYKLEQEKKENEAKIRERLKEKRKEEEVERKRQEELQKQKSKAYEKRHEEYEKKKQILRLEREKQLNIEDTKQRENTTKPVVLEESESHTLNESVENQQRIDEFEKEQVENFASLLKIDELETVERRENLVKQQQMDKLKNQEEQKENLAKQLNLDELEKVDKKENISKLQVEELKKQEQHNEKKRQHEGQSKDQKKEITIGETNKEINKHEKMKNSENEQDHKKKKPEMGGEKIEEKGKDYEKKNNLETTESKKLAPPSLESKDILGLNVISQYEEWNTDQKKEITVGENNKEINKHEEMKSRVNKQNQEKKKPEIGGEKIEEKGKDYEQKSNLETTESRKLTPLSLESKDILGLNVISQHGEWNKDQMEITVGENNKEINKHEEMKSSVNKQDQRKKKPEMGGEKMEENRKDYVQENNLETLESNDLALSSLENKETIGLNVMAHAGESGFQMKENGENFKINILKRSDTLGLSHSIENDSNAMEKEYYGGLLESHKNAGEYCEQDLKSEETRTSEFVMKDASEECLECSVDRGYSVKYSLGPLSLPGIVEEKRLAWMKTCNPWSKVFMENQRKKIIVKNRVRAYPADKMPPLKPNAILQCGLWSTLQQVTTIMFQDLPGCSLSTLSECPSLQFLSLRHCGLTALDGLGNCKDLRYIDVQENNIQYINCENLENLCILLLNKNQLTSLHGLDGCNNIRNLELSYNKITQIGGLESLKNLQQLSVAHNQLISSKGLGETPTLMHLDCSYNHLSELEGIENCGLLQSLKLQGNNLSEVPRLENHVLLRELYLDDNSISTVEKLSSYWLPLLQIFTVSQNSLKTIASLSQFVSLEKMDISNNCLSELTSIIRCLDGCYSLCELSLSGNPLLQEKNWRYSLLETLPALRLLNGEVLNFESELSKEEVPQVKPESFLTLCQNQIKEFNLLTEKYVAKERNVFSLDSAQNLCCYLKELMKISNEFRYVHEHGTLTIIDSDELETKQDHLIQRTKDSSHQNTLFISGVEENKQDTWDFSERWIDSGQNHSLFISPSINDYAEKKNQECVMDLKRTECYIKPEKGEDTKRNIPEISEISRQVERKHQNIQSDEKNAAAAIIQAHWRGYVIRREINLYIRLHEAATLIQSAWRNYYPKRKITFKKEEGITVDTDGLRNKAAILIQAVWKGFLLRKKLSKALAAIKNEDLEDDYEEINLSDFTFNEHPEYLRNDDNSPNLTRQLPQAWQCNKRENSFSQECAQLSSKSESGSLSCQSDLKSCKKIPSKSEKEEQISEEWGFKNISTAQLMLKRAKKMKSCKTRNQKLDPAVRLALFKNNENKHLPVKPPRKTLPARVGYFEAQEEEAVWMESTSTEKIESRREFTYQWLHTQVGGYETTSSRNMKCNRFLPELDPDVLSGGRVQLVASLVSREDTDLDLVSMTSGSALTQNRGKNNQAHRHSAGSSTKVPVPVKTNARPFKKERISFRDHPMQLSGGWGSGKKQGKTFN
ncbi:leucine-rich repeat and IQ domain-containing protein 1 [Tachyglossus aculeatus]|uniref:leucine-rich repeat and IQ domain-containing protein 1 n=1 Tax=Tachyglossus aculeatus TaxID=9261 RepID=UPI0018F5C059|nr:leucine-rich repeat and IQ domain-containing protein 1 [Tachyglossus aculeatus]